jgi:hypothetical protein
MIHANAHAMGITVEPLLDVVARDRALDILAVGRL